MNQLQVYGINLMEVTPTNVALNKRKLDEKPLVIVYNSGKIQNELDENIEQLLYSVGNSLAIIFLEKALAIAEICILSNPLHRNCSHIS